MIVVGCIDKGVNDFIEFSSTQPRFMNDTKIKCPCAAKKCQNQQFLDMESVKVHLVRNEFVPDYEVWTFHGEKKTRPDVRGPSTTSEELTQINPYVNMIVDEGRQSIPDLNVNDDGTTNDEEQPNPNAQNFYDMLEAANEPLWDGCATYGKTGLLAMTIPWIVGYHML